MAGLALACEGRRGRDADANVVPPRQEESSTATDSPSLQFLPRQQEAPGWTMAADPVVVPGDRLPGYLGVQAAELIPFGVLDLTACKYSAPGSEGFAAVEIFRFPDFTRAFGAYSLRKDGPVRTVSLANEAFVARHSLHLWRGASYVRITGGGAPDGNDALIRLAEAVAGRIPAAPGRPETFALLPATNRVPNSERYSAGATWGQPFLANSFQATFNVGGAAVKGLVIPAASREAAAQILEQCRRLYLRNGKLLDPVPNLGEDSFLGEDVYLGRTIGFRIDRFFVAFNGYNERQKLVDTAVAADKHVREVIGGK